MRANCLNLLCQWAMRKLLVLPVLLLSLLVGNPAFSDDFQKGLTAYKNGDYETASREWNPLVKQENAEAQYNLGIEDGFLSIAELAAIAREVWD